MQFRQNASVYTADGKDLGRVNQVVIDPTTQQVTHIVVRHGFLFVEEKVIPTDLIGAATEKRITLREDADDLRTLPLFEAMDATHGAGELPTRVHEEAGARHIPPRRAEAPALRGSPQALRGLHGAHYATESESDMPGGTMALQEGAKVITADGKHVGTVERVLTEPQKDRATNLVISQGLLVKERRRVPIAWVNEVNREGILLAVASRTLDELGFMPDSQ